MLCKAVDFYFTFYISMPNVGVSAPSCRTAMTAEKEQHILQVCRNLNSGSTLLAKCSKALVVSNVVLLRQLIYTGKLIVVLL